MSIFEKIKEIFSRRKVKLLQEEIHSTLEINLSSNTKEQESVFKEQLKENAQIHIGKKVIEDLFQEKNKYYEDKILQLIGKFKELYIRMLKDKNAKDITGNELFSIISIKTQKMYPELESKIKEVSFYYSSERDSEQKLYYMLNLYKVIEEKVYGN